MKLGIKQSNHACLCRHTCPTCSLLQRANGMHELTFRCELHRGSIQRGGSLGRSSLHTVRWLSSVIINPGSSSYGEKMRVWFNIKLRKLNLEEKSFSDSDTPWCKTTHFLLHSVSYKWIPVGCEEAFKIIQVNFISHLITLRISLSFALNVLSDSHLEKKNLGKMESFKGNLICLLECSLIQKKVDGTIRRLRGSGRWSHQRFLREWRETVK